MIPILYDANETEFKSMGIGPLADATDCKVNEERNGSYELTLKYPKGGQHYADIEINRIILAIPSPYRDAQPFRIYKVSKPMRGVITVNAQHISYDLSGITVNPFTGNSVADVLSKIVPNSVNENRFKFSGNSTTTHTCNYSKPNSARQILGGMEGSIIDIFGGEYEFDRFNVRWNLKRGVDSGVTIKYGKNLLNVSQEVDASGIVTGVVPYWIDYEGNNTVFGSRIDLEGSSSVTKVVPLNLSSYFDVQPSVQQLNDRAKTYIKQNYTNEPSISCEVSFAIIEQSEEYKEFRLLEKCDLCDTLTVNYPDLGINSTAKIVEIETDVLKEKYNKVTIGSLRANLAQTIVAQQKQVNDIPTMSTITSLVGGSLSEILGANGGAVRLLDTNDDGEMDTLYIADDPDPAKANKVWRFNYLGWAASKNGYNGPFTLGATLEAGLLADFVTAANLVAGTITSADSGNTFFLDLDNGVLRMNASQLTISGSTINEIAKDEASDAIDNLSQRDIYNKLTNNSENQGLYLDGTNLYINASYISTGQIQSKDGTTFFLDLDEGILRMNASQFSISGTSIGNYVDNMVDTATDDLESRLSKAESTLTVQAGEIAAKVSQGDLQSAIIQNASSIRLSASEISWESEKSSLTNEGVFTSRSAWNDNNWLRIENGEIFGGQGTTQYSEIDVSSTVGGKTGITLSGQQIYLDAETQVYGDLNVVGSISGSSLNISGKAYASGDIECYGDFINGGNRGYTGTFFVADGKYVSVLGGIIIDVAYPQ